MVLGTSQQGQDTGVPCADEKKITYRGLSSWSRGLMQGTSGRKGNRDNSGLVWKKLRF